MKTKAELIQAKVLHNLQKSEEAEFERLVSEDKDFAKEYEMVAHLSDYVKDEKVYQFRETLNEASQQHKNERTKTKTIKLKTYWKQIASVAAVLVVFLGSYWYLNEQTNSELFQEYYQLDEVYLNTRSGNSTTTDLLEQGLMLFEKDQYQESIGFFEQLPTSVTAIYYSGVAHMEIGEYEVAKYKFDQVIDDYVNVFYDQALWYKGLCLLKQDKVKDAKGIFKTISKSESYYKNQAKDIADKLK